MDLKELLEKDRDRVLGKLSSVEEVGGAALVVEDELERIMLEAAQEGAFPGKEGALNLALQTAKAAAGFLDGAGEPRVFELVPIQGATGKPPATLAGKTELLAGVGFALLGAALPAVNGLGALFFLFRAAFTGAGMFLTYRWAKGEAVRLPAPEPIRTVKVPPDTEKILHQMTTVLQVAEEQVQSLPEPEQAPARWEVEMENLTDVDLSPEELKLLVSLLEAAIASEDPATGKEVSTEVRFYLHRHGIEVVDDYLERPEVFDGMPGRIEALIRPALVKEGKVLCRGLCVREEVSEEGSGW